MPCSDQQRFILLAACLQPPPEICDSLLKERQVIVVGDLVQNAGLLVRAWWYVHAPAASFLAEDKAVHVP